MFHSSSFSSTAPGARGDDGLPGIDGLPGSEGKLPHCKFRKKSFHIYQSIFSTSILLFSVNVLIFVPLNFFLRIEL